MSIQWLEIGQHTKLLYHLYRIHPLVKNYKESGKFEPYLFDKDKENIIDYKIKNENTEKHLSNFKEIINYLEATINDAKK